MMMRTIEERNALVQQHMKLVPYFGQRYRKVVEWEEIISAGYEGLIVAAERWDETRGVAFASYAQHWIRQRMLLVIRNKDMVRVPHTATAGVKANGDDKRAPFVAAATRAPLSLNRSVITDDDDSSLENAVADERAASPEDAVGRDLAALMLRSPRLAPRERVVLALALGMDGAAPLSFSAAGRKIGLTRERVRQIYVRAVLKLRRDPAIVKVANALDINTRDAPPPITHALVDPRTL